MTASIPADSTGCRTCLVTRWVFPMDLNAKTDAGPECAAFALRDSLLIGWSFDLRCRLKRFRWLVSSIPFKALDPVQHDSGDLVAVLLDEHEVPVALDADVLQMDPVVPYAGLGEVLCSPGVPGGVVPRRARGGQAGNLGKVGWRPSRRGLHI